MNREGWIPLEAKNAVEARREVRRRWPQGGSLHGFKDNVAVYLTVVRKVGDKSPVATAVRNRGPKPTYFTCLPNDVDADYSINRHFTAAEATLIKTVIDHRMAYPDITDREFQSLKALREKFNR